MHITVFSRQWRGCLLFLTIGASWSPSNVVCVSYLQEGNAHEIGFWGNFGRRKKVTIIKFLKKRQKKILVSFIARMGLSKNNYCRLLRMTRSLDPLMKFSGIRQLLDPY